jgi:hypothetical protein
MEKESGMMRNLVVLFLLAAGGGLHAQTACELSLENSRDRMMQHIQYLASDELEGRYPGTEGAEKAREYISLVLRQNGARPALYDDGSQWFTVPRLATFPPTQNGLFNDRTYAGAAWKNTYPHPHTANGSASGKIKRVKYGIVAPDLGRNDFRAKNVVGKIALIEAGTPDGKGPHGKFAKYLDLDTRIDHAIRAGAVGVVLVPGKKDDLLPSPMYKSTRPSSVPVVVIPRRELPKGWTKLETFVQRQTAQAANVCGFVDNRAEKTLVLGAHYDHLGWGLEHSLHRGDPQIHNGADDNASGVAVLLEAARLLQELPFAKSFNYLIVGFSAEEDGLLGSQHFVQNRPPEFKNLFAMLNFDMVGRMEKGNPLIVSGVGTALEWNEVLTQGTCLPLSLKTETAPGSASDHASFYRQGIPVLHFFTGAHGDYHRPTDDVEKIEPLSVEATLRTLLGTVEALSQSPQLSYQEIKEPEAGRSMSFKVSLGVVPDYAFSGNGMRIAGLSDGKPAQKAGLLAGDVVVEFGGMPVRDMTSYMTALSAFTKGQKVKVVVLRGTERLTKDILL